MEEERLIEILKNFKEDIGEDIKIMREHIGGELSHVKKEN